MAKAGSVKRFWAYRALVSTPANPWNTTEISATRIRFAARVRCSSLEKPLPMMPISGSASSARTAASVTNARAARLKIVPTRRHNWRSSRACWTKTGTNAAVLTVPTSRSYRVLGSVRAITKASVSAVAPKVEAMTTSRTSPRPRLRTLPRAMTAAALATRRRVRLRLLTLLP